MWPAQGEEGGLEGWEVASLWPCSQRCLGMPCSGAEAWEEEEHPPFPPPSPSKGPQGEAALPAGSSQTSGSSSEEEEEELGEPASPLSSSPQTAREWRIPLR